eukprot:5638030-Ditylum_brightwellii.AAC.1
MEAMMKLNAWEEIDISDVSYTAEGICCTVIESTWAFKVKRYPDGAVKKHKAQLCLHRDQQVKDADYFETYSPVVSWTTVRMMMTLAVNLGLKSRHVDYTNNFVQASLSPGEEAPLTGFNKLSQGLQDA